MLSFIVRRLALSIPTLFGVLVVVFLLLYVAPGDPVQEMVGERVELLASHHPSPEEADAYLRLLGDAVSHEVFVYGGDTVNGFVELLSRVNGAGRFGPALAMVTGQAAGKNPNEIQARYYLHVLAQNVDLIRAPDLVLGFRLRDAKRAESQLKRLEGLLLGTRGLFVRELMGIRAERY